ncbi:Predicted DNA-binding transcriptional regulator YafY, contains an HTH and WYL domains [Arenibacter nanhaiticus]|uniref:Predicted DNA-binding transcriptional regulator YafY, contains an HTH and WYL domains n=1 Tax=Arenibacter nanhaiticus TaxID=558155 RepID=A0A1M6KXA5_9FLAO|nr:WYL domain-containing protein [Arenibacter nanhaiticus]SHJ63603.1 Predicted DNA-binding transcriptional regulator YafY, contains an HTH and WYL domains [Arenibacter nanhaiticus]
MANSKHAHLRYNILDYCFRYRSLSFEELLEVVNEGIAELYPGEGISERSLRKDLRVFRDDKKGFNAPLPEKIRILKYSDPKFSIAQRPLLEYEQYLIDAAQQLLSRFENHPKYDRLAEALIKFQDEEDPETDISKILYYDLNEEYKGIQHLKPLYLAIKKKEVLQITYKGFKDQESRVFIFHPHLLKQYNRRWFVFGLNSSKGIKEWSIPLDERLIGFKVIEDMEYLESDTDWDNFFRTMVGVVRLVDAEVEKVVLRFHNGRENYFKTKPFQPDYEEFFEEDKQNQVWFETIINNELIQQILSYGQDVEVLLPEHLKTKMSEHVKTMQEFYNT